jgi:hypothetical protein
VNPPLRQYPKDIRNRIVGLNDDVRQVNVPNNLHTEERKRWAERKKVYKGLHVELLCLAVSSMHLILAALRPVRSMVVVTQSILFELSDALCSAPF